MPLTIQQIIETKYPGCIEKGLVSFRNPAPYDKIYIQDWNIDGVEKPNEDDLMLESSLLERDYLLMQLKKEATLILRERIDEVARSKDYDDAASIVGYINSTNPLWKEEAQVFIAWRDLVFSYAYNVFDSIQNGGDIPSNEEFSNSIPDITWP